MNDFIETEADKHYQVVAQDLADFSLTPCGMRAFPAAQEAMRRGLEKAAKVIETYNIRMAMEARERIKEMTSYITFPRTISAVSHDVWEHEIVEPPAVAQGTTNCVTSILALQKDKTKVNKAQFQKQCLNAMRRRGRRK